MRGKMRLDPTLVDGPKVRKSDRMMRVLLQERSHQDGGVITDLHGQSEAAEFPAALVPLLLDECAKVPSGGRNFAGADKDPAFQG